MRQPSLQAPATAADRQSVARLGGLLSGIAFLLLSGTAIALVPAFPASAAPVGLVRGSVKSAKSADAARAQQLQDRAKKLSQGGTQAAAEEAIALYEEALQIWETSGNLRGQVTVLLQLASIHYNLSQNERTRARAQQALAISRELQEPRLEAFSLTMVGNAYLHLEEPRKALEFYQQAIPLFQAGDLPGPAATVEYSIGNAHQRLGETDAAIASFKRALAFYRRQNNLNGQSQLLNALGVIYIATGDTENARAVFTEDLTLQQQAGDPIGQANAHRALGLFYAGIGDNRQSLAAYERAIALYDGAEQASGQQFVDRLSYAGTLMGLGAAYFFNGRPQESLATFDRALLVAEETGSTLLMAEVLSNASIFRAQLGETQAALDLQLQALELRKALNQPVREASALRRIAELYFTLGEPQKTLDFYAQALELQRRVGAKPDEAVTLTELAYTYRELGDYDLALEHYERALALFQQVGDRAGEARAYEKRGGVYFQQEKYQDALEAYARALQLHRTQDNRLQQASVLISQALTYETLEQYPQALEAAAEVLELARAIEQRFFESIAWTMQGRVRIANGKPRQALEDLSRARAIAREIEHRPGEVSILDNIGKAHRDLDELPQALEAYTQVLALTRDLGDRAGEAGALYDLALVERQRNRLPAAQEYAEDAIEITESLRGKLVSPELRTAYISTIYQYYELYIDLLMQRHQQSPEAGFDAEALHVSERARARGLLELLTEANADIERGVDPQLLAAEKSLQQRLQQNEKRRVELYATPNPAAERAQAIERERQQLLAEAQEIQNRIRAASPRYAALQYPEPLKLADIQQQILDEETVLLQFSLGEERSYLWAVTQNELHSYVLPDRATIEATARTLRRQIGLQDSRLPETARQLAQMLLEPVADRLQENDRVRRIAIVGDGVLQYVPFAALPQPGRADGEILLARYEVVSLPSSSTLATLREFGDRAPAPKALAIFADPVFTATDNRVRQTAAAPLVRAGSTERGLAARRAQADLARAAQNLAGDDRNGRDVLGWTRLPGTRQEAEAIARLLDTGDPLQKYDFDVNYQAVTDSEALSQYRVLHFATHGILDSANPELSGLVLSLVDREGRPQNGYLRLHEIFNLKLAADLVVLSACETGLGQDIRGEGIVGMTRGFMYAGSPRVLVSLWSVDDAATAALMVEFYENMLQRNLDPAAALQAAQLTIRENPQWAAPFYWAGFTLQGEWQRSPAAVAARAAQ